MTAKTKPRAYRPPQRVRQVFGPFGGMRMVAEETADTPTRVQYALNMTCADPEHGAAYCVRPPAVVTSGLPAGIPRCFHVLDLPTGAVPVAIMPGGEIWALTSETAWNRLVSSADFASKSIGLDANAISYFALTFAGKMIVSDGVNTPWSWDGTSGSDGLTSLTACPALYGQPTEYAGKLFGIKAEDRRTIVWSEENDATTGYEAAGFNNAWTISQQADTPLVATCGRNDGLYYWRTQGFGVIAGAVAGDFRTTHTHDALSTTVGLIAPGVWCDSGDALWWYGSNERIYRYAIGGRVQDVSPDITAQHSDQVAPLVPRWLRSAELPNAQAYAPYSRACVVGPNDVNDRMQVWFALPGRVGGAQSSQSGAGPASVVLVYDTTTARPISWYAPWEAGSSPLALAGFRQLSDFRASTGAHGRFAVAYDGFHGVTLLWHWQTGINQSPLEFGTSVPGYVVGPTIGGDPEVEQTILRVDAVLRVPPSGTIAAGTASGSVALTLPDTALQSLVQGPDTWVPTNRHVTFGVEQVARAVRPVWQFRWAAFFSQGHRQGFGIERYSVTSSGLSEDPDAA